MFRWPMSLARSFVCVYGDASWGFDMSWHYKGHSKISYPYLDTSHKNYAKNVFARSCHSDVTHIVDEDFITCPRGMERDVYSVIVYSFCAITLSANPCRQPRLGASAYV